MLFRSWQVLRFNPKNEKFELYPTPPDSKGKKYVSIKDVKKTSCGNIWMVGYNNGCIRAQIDSTNNIITTYFCTTENNKVGDVVNCIYEDNFGKTWILTNNGISCVSEVDTRPSEYFLVEQNLLKTKLFAIIDSKN